MNNIKLFIKGFIIGLGKIMPGVSGSVMAISLGVYEKLINSFSNLSDFKKNLNFLIPIIIGIILSIILGSKMILFLLETHKLYTISFFIGLMIPGIIPLFKEIKNRDLTPKRVFISILVFSSLILINTISIKGSTQNDTNFISLFLCGILDAITSIVPGISGSALLMLVGYYNTIIEALANTYIITLIPFILGLLIGIVLTSKIIDYLFKNKRVITMMLIIVFSSFSILTLIQNTLSNIQTPIELFISLSLQILGITLSNYLNRLFKE